MKKGSTRPRQAVMFGIWSFLRQFMYTKTSSSWTTT